MLARKSICTRQNIVNGLRNPSLLYVFLRRFFILGGALRDPECMHLVRAWSSGALPRLHLPQIFPGIETCPSVSVRAPESRTIGWSIDLQELIHILSVVKFTGVKRILEVGTY